MPLKGDGNKFVGNKIGVHNEALSGVELNNSTFENNGIGYLEGKYSFMDGFFAESAPQPQRDNLLSEINDAVKNGHPEKADSIFKKYDFHKWIATGVNITKIVAALKDAGAQLLS